MGIIKSFEQRCNRTVGTHELEIGLKMFLIYYHQNQRGQKCFAFHNGWNRILNLPLVIWGPKGTSRFQSFMKGIWCSDHLVKKFLPSQTIPGLWPPKSEYFKHFTCKGMGHGFKGRINHSEPCTYSSMNSSREKLMSLTYRRLIWSPKVHNLVCLSQKKTFYHMGHDFKEHIKHSEPGTYSSINSRKFEWPEPAVQRRGVCCDGSTPTFDGDFSAPFCEDGIKTT